MKRIAIAVVIMLCMLSVSGYSLWTIDTITDSLSRQLSDINASQDHPEQQLERIRALDEYWNEKEHRLMLFVRHDLLSELSRSMLKLESLARHEDYGSLYGEIDSIIWQVENVRSCELFRLINLL